VETSLSSILWEDLTEAQSRIGKALSALQALQRAIEEGLVDQPTHQDSKRLNRLMVLAELLYSEIRPWTSELTAGANPNGRRSTAD
jgi:hypothetical protein